MPHRNGCDGRTGDEQVFRLHQTDKPSHNRHHNHGYDTTRRKHQPRQRRGIVQLRLQQLRKDLRRGDHNGAGAQHE